MNRLQHLLYGFLVGLGFMSLSLVDLERFGPFGDLIYFINTILFYVGYGVVVFLGVWILFIVMVQLGNESQKERE
ncbi:hypothetical protein ABE65_012255 [Fictibacillus phosphorivorans]|uniref:Uncharacterized protein n=1 Tax=Fictibacillus phosphorivorans TaxID=1221500 RepID=A0A160IMG4_9BACL|nr:hypothetical protein [Fictibacillus phosphorivorans]ANC77528.1 hypothetical protein ABE65_012255 [Fictibacillus phosphorivorans]